MKTCRSWTDLTTSIQHASWTPGACFRQALDVARRQQAKSLELRATVSLSRRRRQEGKREEVRALLASIYAWFTEGFDMADLQDAKALLDALGAGPETGGA